MTERKRPLSPHIQVYKPQITSLTSILHRATGAFLYIGVVLLCIFISYYAYQIDVSSAQEYKCDCWITRTIIYILAFAWTFSLYYHLCNGIRHLFWDIGKGFEISQAKKTGYLVLFFATLLTIGSFAFIFLFK